MILICILSIPVPHRHSPWYLVVWLWRKSRHSCPAQLPSRKPLGNSRQHTGNDSQSTSQLLFGNSVCVCVRLILYRSYLEYKILINSVKWLELIMGRKLEHYKILFNTFWSLLFPYGEYHPLGSSKNEIFWKSIAFFYQLGCFISDEWLHE